MKRTHFKECLTKRPDGAEIPASPLKTSPSRWKQFPYPALRAESWVTGMKGGTADSMFVLFSRYLFFILKSNLVGADRLEKLQGHPAHAKNRLPDAWKSR